MPWSPADADGHKKGLSKKQKTLWAKVANGALSACLKKGGDDKSCSPKAIRAANAVAGRMGEAAYLASDLSGIIEKGRSLSAESEQKIRAAISALNDLLSKVEGEIAKEAELELDPEILSTGIEALSEARTLLEAEMSQDDVRYAVYRALQAKTDRLHYCSIRDIFDTYVVYAITGEDEYGYGGQLYQADYTIAADGTATLGKPVEVKVQTSYVPAKEAQVPPKVDPKPAEEAVERDLTGELVPLVEKALASDGTVKVKVIAPGWGSSGYYSPEVLKRDGPGAFKSGTKMYWNHPTVSEENERPERDLRDLAAELVEDARWEDSPTTGPGLYTKAKVFSPYREVVEELAPHIGVSIRALGLIEDGEAEGQSGKIVNRLVSGKSVDYVTTPGAGGRALQLFESARNRAGRKDPEPTTPGGTSVDEKEAQALQEEVKTLRAALKGEEEKQKTVDEQIARMQEALLLRDVRDLVTATLAEVQMPDITRARLSESLQKRPVLKDGQLDRDATAEMVKEAVKAELAYLSQATGAGNGQIKGLGSTSPVDLSKPEEADRMLEESMTAFLGNEKAGKLAATGRG